MNAQHPDPFFAEEYDAQEAARAMARAAMARLLIWQADAPTLEDRGLRTTVALCCMRPDLIVTATLEEIGEATGRTKQWGHALAESFRHTTGFALRAEVRAGIFAGDPEDVRPIGCAQAARQEEQQREDEGATRGDHTICFHLVMHAVTAARAKAWNQKDGHL